MSAVLDIDNLLESPLADLHALAGELEIEDYRKLRKPELTIAILEARGVTGDEIRPAVEAKAGALAEAKAAHEAVLAEQEAAAEAEREQREAEREESRRENARGQRGGRSRRGGRGGRGRQSDEGGERKPRERDGAKTKAKSEGEGKPREKKDRPPEPTQPLSGVFEPGAGGGGRLRTSLTKRVRGDADVPRGEVRRWNLQPGDLIAAEVKKARRGRTDFVVASIGSVNGLDQEAKKQKRPSFAELPAAALGAQHAKKTFKHAKVNDGSRTVVTGPTRAASSEMLAKLAGELAGEGIVTTLVIVSARPDQANEATGLEVIAGDATKSPEGILPALELALARDQRLAETGRATALLVDGLDLLPAEKAAEIFNAARNLDGAGSLTVAAACGAGSTLEALATSIGVVSGGRKLKLDRKASWTQN